MTTRGSARQSASVEQARIVEPTDEHRRLARACRELLAGPVPELAREPVSRARGKEGQRQLSRLEGTLPASLKELTFSAEHIRSVVHLVELGKTWPAPSSHKIPRLQGALTLDANASKKAWSQTPAIPLCFPCSSLEPARPHATCKLLYDAANLYLLFEVPDHDIQTPYLNRGESVSQADCVEFFITSQKAFGQYIEVNASPLGVTYDTLNRKRLDAWGGEIEKAMLDLPPQLAVKVDGQVNDASKPARGYVIEYAFPFSLVPGMESGARSGDVFFGLLGWANRDGQGTQSQLTYCSHVPILAWFHNIWGYSRFTLE